MHSHNLNKWTHHHNFANTSSVAARRSLIVLIITFSAMIIEIIGGLWFNSLALLADGWHMGSHALAIGITVFAYWYSKKHIHDRTFCFGTWKVEVLGGYTSAILLVVIAGLMLFESIERFLTPEPINYQAALVIAFVGLAVNAICALLLGFKTDEHHHHHNHHHHHHHNHSDLNLKAAYLHVLTDALTSVLAILALSGGLMFGWAWLDPMMGIVGAALVTIWARSLIRQTSSVLLDREMDEATTDSIREELEKGTPADKTVVADLHLWRVGNESYACAATVVTHNSQLDSEAIKNRLKSFKVAHTTLEIQVCKDV